jgi:hypothetical protein
VLKTPNWQTLGLRRFTSSAENEWGEGSAKPASSSRQAELRTEEWA